MCSLHSKLEADGWRSAAYVAREKSVVSPEDRARIFCLKMIRVKEKCKRRDTLTALVEKSVLYFS